MGTSVEELRNANRLDPTKDTAIVHDLLKRPVTAVVVDESFGGIGIAVPIKLSSDADKQHLVDREITVEYGGVKCVAVVRHVARMVSGCRLGLEWKAQALSRVLRDLLSVKADSNQELVRVLPGGLSLMWKLYEAGHWPMLKENAARLRKQVRNCGADQLLESIEEFFVTVSQVAQDASMDAQEAKDQIHAALNQMISECIAVIS